MRLLILAILVFLCMCAASMFVSSRPGQVSRSFTEFWLDSSSSLNTWRVMVSDRLGVTSIAWECSAPYGDLRIPDFVSTEYVRRSRSLFAINDADLKTGPIPRESRFSRSELQLPHSSASRARDRTRILEIVCGLPFKMLRGSAEFSFAHGARVDATVRNTMLIQPCDFSSGLHEFLVTPALVWGIRVRELFLNVLCAVVISAFLLLCWRAGLRFRKGLRRALGRCGNCGYPLLQGVPAEQCSECGGKQSMQNRRHCSRRVRHLR